MGHNMIREDATQYIYDVQNRIVRYPVHKRKQLLVFQAGFGSHLFKETKATPDFRHKSC
jgi:hypothetical protein